MAIVVGLIVLLYAIPLIIILVERSAKIISWILSNVLVFCVFLIPVIFIGSILFSESKSVKPTVQSHYVSTTCGDGWISRSTGRGTCSWHKGVSNYNYKYTYHCNDEKYPILRQVEDKYLCFKDER